MSETESKATETWTIETAVETARRCIPRGARYSSWKQALRAAERAGLKYGAHVFGPRKVV
jgi:hypothetical protein